MAFPSTDTRVLSEYFDSVRSSAKIAKSEAASLRAVIVAGTVASTHILRFVQVANGSRVGMEAIIDTPGLADHAAQELGKVDGASWNDYPVMLSALESAISFATNMDASGKVTEQKLIAQQAAELKPLLDALVSAIA